MLYGDVASPVYWSLKSSPRNADLIQRASADIIIIIDTMTNPDP
jgi:hypothetical protein